MKKILSFIFIGMLSHFNAQTAFWTENFGTNPTCQTFTATSYSSSNGAWAVVSTGSNDMFANEWYISAKESNTGIGNCSDGCSNTPTLTNMSMHVSTGVGDLGAAYLAGPGVSNTDKRLETPVINCSNATAITMTLSYIMWGVTNQDYCQFYYFDGSNWSSLGIPAQTPTNSCAGQGIWTGYTVTLPASANNNPNVKLGFRWQNISTSGADPSIAIDDIALIGTVSTPSVVMSPSFSIPTSLCAGQTATLTANTGTTSATGYTWSSVPSGANFSAINGSVTTVSFPNANTYSVTLTAASGTVVGSVTHTITVNPSPTISIAANSTSLCLGSVETLTASGAATYTWMPGNTNGTTLAASPTVNTTYTVTGTSSVGCIGNNTITLTVVTCTSTGIALNGSKAENINVYPNPFTDKLIIESNVSSFITYAIIDITGKKIRKGSINANSDKIELDLSELEKGVYFIEFRDEQAKLNSIKIVK
ncbi:MAG: T9SS type A sorting domain-containing protein [Bacteroidia bacterium]